MNQEIFNPILRTLIAFSIVIISARFVGRKIIAQMTFFDFVAGVTIGSITANLAIGQERSVLSVSTILICFAVLAVLTDFLHMKSTIFRNLMDTKPRILIMNGKINNDNMKKTRMTIDELTMQLREKDVFNYADVEFAIIEPDGKLSILLKSQKLPVTPSDLHIPTTYNGLTKDIIIDGKILCENLESIHLDEKWLHSQLVARGIQNAENILYAGLDTSGNLYVSEKSK